MSNKQNYEAVGVRIKFITKVGETIVERILSLFERREVRFTFRDFQ